MKKFLLPLFIFISAAAAAQNYGNEWINYSRTYYKFKIGQTGLYRLTQPVLSGLGLGAVPVEQFQLWRNGQEVRMHSTNASGVMTNTDFLEFWGEQNDGKIDNQLYKDPQYQLSDKWSLETDTAAFFLTVNPAGNNLRYDSRPNNVVGNSLPVEPFFMYTAGKYYKDKINPGYAAVVGEYVYSSAYDMGEGWTSGDMPNGFTISTLFEGLRPYTGGGAPAPHIKVNATGNALNPRQYEVKLAGNSMGLSTMDFFDYFRSDFAAPNGAVNAESMVVEVTNRCTIANDRMAVASIELVYPHRFDFVGSNNFEFTLPASATGNYLEISNFVFGAANPVFYDITNGKRYVGDLGNPSFVRVVLEPSATERRIVLVSQHTNYPVNVTSLQPRNFINYGLAANQGNFMIISHPALTVSTSSGNPVENYRAYRSSAAGGSHIAKIYMIDEVLDQFGYGIKKNPNGLRNFIRWARNNFSSPVKNVLLIGKGLNYQQFRLYENAPDIDKLSYIPTYGQPASDNLLGADPGADEIPKVSIGRISAVNGDEVAVYLSKLQQYEQQQAFQSPYIRDKAWMKNVVHVIGASDPALGAILTADMNHYQSIIIDTFYGANLNTFSKVSAAPVEQTSSQRLQALFQEGIGLITYFGHSSASTLEFNLDNPDQYNNPSKYPITIVMGCNAGNFFNYTPTRLISKETLSEKYVLADQRGSIAFVASSHFGIVHYLDIFNTRTYNAASITHYGKSLGEILRESITQTYALTTQNDYYARFHCEQTTLHGDPAIKLDISMDKPDYVIEDQLIKVNPSFISVAETHFHVDAKFMNLGKAPPKNIVIEVRRTYPDLTTEVVRRDTIPGIRYMDSLSYDFPIVATRDKGLNKISFCVDADNVADEIYETNNCITKDIFVFEDEARPVYPYNYGIVNQQGAKLVASTANPYSTLKTYTMEMDTTEFFNSPFKITRTISSTGGVLEFVPNINFTDSTVYYWRVSPNPTSGQPVWNKASFVYLSNAALGSSDPGFNQSHFYQHTKSVLERMTLDSSSRKWSFNNITQNLFVRNGVFPTACSQAACLSVAINGVASIRSVCGISNIIINVIDPITFDPWVNADSGPGQYGSDPVCGIDRRWNFQYNILDSVKRRQAMEFLDLIPDGFYVVVRNTSGTNPLTNTYAADWANDENHLGAGNSIYHRLKAQGFADIDTFNAPRAFGFVYQKNRSTTFTPRWAFTQGIADNLTLSVDCITPDTLGYMTSPVFGPARAWKQLKWRGQGDVNGDVPTVDVIGIKNDGTETVLVSALNQSQQDYNISNISALQYPNLKLRLRTQDSVNFTPYQLRYWRITYDPVPEGAIAPNIYLKVKDTVEVGEPMDYKVAFKNISVAAFDSLKLKLIVTDRNNLPTIVPLSKRRPLPVGDTLQIGTVINTSGLSGFNTIYIEANPDNDQPEQFHFNNFAYRSLYVKPDSLNPLMDVTFDNVHILNRDIVSSKPDITIKLKDEARWLILDDTSLLTLQVRFPNGSLKKYFFNNDTLRFTPAGQAPNPDNTALITFRPYFAQDGEYELIVTGKDKSNNAAGDIAYRVMFEVINKPMISNMLNYPNPFTTSTAFVFTITGVEVPQNIKIEIMTITGKLVREITKDELGPLHVGRNITDFKWDGTDQYGQKLANGIYLYRVVTNLNGKALDKYKAADDKTDQFFNKGYGKMYLMR